MYVYGVPTNWYMKSSRTIWEGYKYTNRDKEQNKLKSLSSFSFKFYLLESNNKQWSSQLLVTTTFCV